MSDDAPVCTFCGDEVTVRQGAPFGLTTVNICADCEEIMPDIPALSPPDPLRPTEAEVAALESAWDTTDELGEGLRAAYALALPRMIPLLVAQLPDEMMLTAADREEHQRQENEALSAGCETGEIAAVMRRVTAALIAERRDDLVVALLAAAARLTEGR